MPETTPHVHTHPADSSAAAAACPQGIAAWVAALRPRQWTKNVVVFAGVIFSGKLTDRAFLLEAGAMFLIFCLLSSVGYLINDLLDVTRDRAHPIKCRRPIAAGTIHPSAAVVVACLLGLLALGSAWLLKPVAAGVALGYLVLTLTYSIWWKHQVILDVMALAGAFVLRAYAGTEVLSVSISPWLFVCVMLLALLLGLGKRRHELTLLADKASSHRPVLKEYGLPFLNQALTSVSSAAMVTYATYAITSTTAVNYPKLVVTVPLVVFAILRYMYLVLHRNGGGQPEELFLSDRPFYLTVAIWTVTVIVIFLLGPRV